MAIFMRGKFTPRAGERDHIVFFGEARSRRSASCLRVATRTSPRQRIDECRLECVTIRPAHCRDRVCSAKAVQREPQGSARGGLVLVRQYGEVIIFHHPVEDPFAGLPVMK